MKMYYVFLICLFSFFSLWSVSGQSEETSLGSRRTEEELKVLAERIESQHPDISQAILKAVKEVPRKPFLPNEYTSLAYENTAVPAEKSSYYPSVDTTVTMLDHLPLNGRERVLVIGTHTGYAAGLLSRLSSSVFVVELSEAAGTKSEAVYQELKMNNITLLKGDTLVDWKSYGPFNSILIHGAVSQIPAQLNAQLVREGVLLVPLRDPWDIQILLKVTKKQESLSFQVLEDLLFPAINLPDDFR